MKVLDKNLLIFAVIFTAFANGNVIRVRREAKNEEPSAETVLGELLSFAKETVTQIIETIFKDEETLKASLLKALSDLKLKDGVKILADFGIKTTKTIIDNVIDKVEDSDLKKKLQIITEALASKNYTVILSAVYKMFRPEGEKLYQRLSNGPLKDFFKKVIDNKEFSDLLEFVKVQLRKVISEIADEKDKKALEEALKGDILDFVENVTYIIIREFKEVLSKADKSKRELLLKAIKSKKIRDIFQIYYGVSREIIEKIFQYYIHFPEEEMKQIINTIKNGTMEEFVLTVAKSL